MSEGIEAAEQRHLLAAIVDSSDDAIISKDLNGIVTSWNRGAQRIFGYEAGEAIGRPILMVIPQDRRQEEPEILGRIRKGERVDHFETIRIGKNGQYIEVSLTISPVRNSEGVIIGASKIVRDITEKKRVEKALADAQKQLQTHAATLEKSVVARTRELRKTIAELEAFSYSLTHDLRAPLRAIQSFLQIFREDYGAKVEQEGIATLQKAIDSAQRMDRMVLDLLAFTRLSHEAMPIEDVDTEKLVREIIRERPELHPAKAEIHIQSPLAKVLGNEASLSQCLTNLLDNAVKFVAPGTHPKIRIHTEEKESSVWLWIEDNGVGIDVEAQKQLFRMFHRAHGGQYPGTGIGLAIVRKAVDRMNGTAGIESEPGKGSRFWLQLPRATT